MRRPVLVEQVQRANVVCRRVQSVGRNAPALPLRPLEMPRDIFPRVLQMTLDELCRRIDLPEPVTTSVMRCAAMPELAAAASLPPLGADRASWPGAIETIAAALGPDADGMKMLTFMLLRACAAHERYVALGIDDRVYVDTMAFCTRFVEDHYRTHGVYAFTWGWWLPRQITLSEFRVGALEFELVDEADAATISIHIPGDADLQPAALRRSVDDARALIARVAPRFAQADMVCDSWLLDPVLRALLDERSNILTFQSGFDITGQDPASPHAVRWIFGRYDLAPADLPETTSLQRRVKAMMLDGRSIGSAQGRLRADAWLG